MLDNSRRRGFGLLVTGLVAMLLGCEPNLRPERPGPEPKAPRVPEPVGVVEGEASRSLLQGYIERDPDVADDHLVCPDSRPLCTDAQRVRVPMTWEEESQTWRLPYQSKRLIAALLIAAAHDRLESLRFLLTPEAQWGWPSTLRLKARPVWAGDEGETFFQALRAAGQRIPEKPDWTSYPVPPGVEMLLRTGAEAMWLHIVAKQGAPGKEVRDALLFHLVTYQGAARIDYVGLFEQLPEEAPVIDRTFNGDGDPPPFRTPLRPPIVPPPPEP
jgi:hypothetical protein